jgi:hypothetical protein
MVSELARLSLHPKVHRAEARMLVCQWHLDVPYGKQAEAVSVMRAWGAEKFAGSEGALASLIVPGSQRWVVYRVVDEPRG